MSLSFNLWVYSKTMYCLFETQKRSNLSAGIYKSR